MQWESRHRTEVYVYVELCGYVRNERIIYFNGYRISCWSKCSHFFHSKLISGKLKAFILWVVTLLGLCACLWLVVKVWYSGVAPSHRFCWWLRRYFNFLAATLILSNAFFMGVETAWITCSGDAEGHLGTAKYVAQGHITFLQINVLIVVVFVGLS